MAQRVQAPNGDILEFPDDMSEQDMLNALQKEYGAPKTPAAEPTAPVAPVPAPAPVDSGPKTPATGFSGDLGPRAPLIYNQPLTGHPKELKDAWDALPWYLKIPQAAGDVLNSGLDAATLGYANKASAKLASLETGKPYDELIKQAQQDTADAGIRAGGAGTAARVAGAVAGPGKLSVVERAAAQVPWAIGRLGVRLGLGGAEGATYGGLDAAGHDKPVDEGAASGALWGGALSSLTPAVTSILGRLGGISNRQPPIPDTDELRRAKDAAYTTAGNSGYRVPEADIRHAVTQMGADAFGDNISQLRHPRAYSTLQDVMDYANGGSRSLDELDKLRQSIMRDTGGDRAEKHFGDIFTGHLDNLMNSTPDAPLLQQARDANKRYRNSDMLDTLESNAELPGGSVPRGAASLARNPRVTKFLSPEEEQALRELAIGTPTRRAADFASRYSGWSRLPALVAGTKLSGNPVGGIGAAFAVPTAIRGAADAVSAAANARALENTRRVMTGAVAQPNQLQRAMANPGNIDDIKKLLFWSQQEQPQ